MHPGKCEKCCNCECTKKYFSLPFPLNKTRTNTNKFYIDTSNKGSRSAAGYGYGYATLSHNQANNVKSYLPYSDSSSYFAAGHYNPTNSSTGAQNNTWKRPVLGLSNRNVYASSTAADKMKPKYRGNGDTTGKSNLKPFNPFGCETPRLFTAPPVVPRAKGQAVTSAVRNYDAGTRRQFSAIPQGVELYEDDPMNDDIRISRAEFEKLVSKAWTSSSTPLTEGDKYQNGRKCTELNQPQFNTIRKSVRDIQKAVGNLRNIPTEIENYVKQDPLLQKKINEKVTKKLNLPLEAKIYKDLFPTNPPEDERSKSVEGIRKELQALQPPPKPKDPEPSILMFNKPTYSRIKPKLPDPPSKPQKGVPTNVSEEFYLIKSELEFSEKGSNASVLDQRVKDDKD